ncbi:MAG: redoxin domain-containing protein [Lachnospiraceae bacterium]|nr:redoxin domain-containing protein [Lachnospiraceae bacterium]
MNKYVKIIISVLVLVILLAGATFGYRYLSGRYKDKKADNDKIAENTDLVNDTEKLSSTEEAVAGESDAVQETKQEDDLTASEAEDTEDSSVNGTDDEQIMTAPDFKFLNNDGEEAHLSDYFGKPVVLNFWATWCGPCQMEMPYFDTAYKKYGEDINFLIIDLTDGSRDTVDSARAFIEENGFSFPIGFDIEYDGAYTYGVSSIPMTFFIDKDGVPQVYQIGTIEEDVLNEQLELLLN